MRVPCLPRRCSPNGEDLPQWRRDRNGTTNRRRFRIHCSSTAPLCASAPLRENLPRSLCAPPIRASPPSNRSDRRAEAGSGSQRDTTVQTCRFAAFAGQPTICQMEVLLQNPSPANFNPIKSPSAEIKASYRRKGIVTDLSVSKRRRSDSKNRGFCSRTKRTDLTPLPPVVNWP